MEEWKMGVGGWESRRLGERETERLGEWEDCRVGCPRELYHT